MRIPSCCRPLLVVVAVAACAGRPWPVGDRPLRSLGVNGLAMVGDTVHAWLSGGRLVSWKVSERVARPLRLGFPVALAADGSVAVTSVEVGRGTRLEVWALDTRSRVATRTFEDGIEQVLGATRAAVALLVKDPPSAHDPPVFTAIPLDHWTGMIWELSPDDLTPLRCDDRDDTLAMSSDGAKLACARFGLWWTDRRQKRNRLADIARDWRRPEPSDGSDVGDRRKPHFEPPPYDVLSLRLGADASVVYLTYRGADEFKGWRLERWTPNALADDDPPWNQGSIERLATAADGGGRVLAVSPDGGLLVLGDDGAPVTLRRAPGYQPERLAAAGVTTARATAATFSSDGARIATGHADERLLLWEAGTGRLLASTVP